MNLFRPDTINLSKYLFFTGKGGVGKTSIASATAVFLADIGKNILLISTDPASNLQDVFAVPIQNKRTVIKEIPNLSVVNLDPLKSASEYRENVVSPYRGLLPESAIKNMEEQLSGSCTVEIAAFNEFSHFLTDPDTATQFDHVIFDTAPTGHTLRLLQLPAAWNNFINSNTHGASCLGQLAGLGDKRQMYESAVKTLSDSGQTTLLLVARADETPLQEAARASRELAELGVDNQILIINSVLEKYDDLVSESMYRKQQKDLAAMPERLLKIKTCSVPMRSFNITGIEQLRSLFTEDKHVDVLGEKSCGFLPDLSQVIADLDNSGKKVIFTMGKGGVGKTTIAAAIALGLSQRGRKIHLTTTDPAAHLEYIIQQSNDISISRIDESEELKKYQREVLRKARASGASDNDLAYIEEDLRSPCTQEIAVFRAFAEIVDNKDDQIVVIDTAPTGHTLLLLDATQSYSREVERSSGEIPESVRKLLPRLRNEQETAVLIVTLPEATPYHEAMRLEEDLARAKIRTRWWIINASLCRVELTNKLLKARAGNEIHWISQIDEHTDGLCALVDWSPEDMKGDKLNTLFARS